MPARPAITRLPDAVRTALDRQLVERGFADYVALEAWLGEQGYEIGKSSIHRYGQKLQRKLEAIRASTQAAAAIAEAAPDDADLRSSAVMSLVQTEIFDVLVNLQEASDEDVDPITRVKLLSHAAKNIATLSRASVNQKKWMIDLRGRIGAKLDGIEAEARSGARKIDADTLKQVREELYGLVG